MAVKKVRLQKRHKGISLVEIVISMFIVVMIVAIAGSLIRLLIKTNSESYVVTNISSIAHNKIESIRNTSFDSISNGSQDFSSELPSTLPHPRSASVSTSTVATDVKQIKVTIQYGDQQQVYTTYVSKANVDKS